MKPLKLKQDCPTRWNNTQDMLNRLKLSKEAVVSTLAILDSKRCTLDNKDWEVIELSSKILNVFYEVTVEVSSATTVSLSKSSILARIMSERNKTNIDKTFPSSIQKLVRELDEGLAKRFGERESNTLVAQGVLLDPRFKKQGFGDDENYNAAYQAVLDEMQLCSERSTGDQPLNQSRHPQPVLSKSSIWDQFDAKINKLQTNRDPAAACALEMDKYVAEPYLARTEDPLVWWESRKLVYPRLYKIMLTRLCIPATSVPCERIFSKAGHLISERRSRLTGKRVSEIMFVNFNNP